MNNKEFLNWVADRFIHQYKESENVDFVHRLREIANTFPEQRPHGVIFDGYYEHQGFLIEVRSGRAHIIREECAEDPFFDIIVIEDFPVTLDIDHGPQRTRVTLTRGKWIKRS